MPKPYDLNAARQAVIDAAVCVEADRGPLNAPCQPRVTECAQMGNSVRLRAI